MEVYYNTMRAIIPVSQSFFNKRQWAASWTLRAHLPNDFVCEIDVEIWLKDNCVGKYMFKTDKAFLNTYTIRIAEKEDATLFALRWLNSEN